MMDTGQCSPRHAGTNGPSSYIPQRPDARWDRVFFGGDRSGCCNRATAARADAGDNDRGCESFWLSAHAFCEAERRRSPMTSALAGTFIILSVGILMAHAMDAFRSGS